MLPKTDWSLRLFLVLTAVFMAVVPLRESWAQAGLVPDQEESGANSLQVQEERVQQLIDTLEDDQKRQELLAQLRLLLEAQAQAEPPDERPTVGDQLLGQLSEQFEALGDAVDAVVEAPEDMLEMWDWLAADVGSDSGRSRWHDILRTMAISIGAAVIAFFVFAVPLRRLGNRIARYSRTTLQKLLAGLAGFVLDAIPVAAFAFAGSAALASTNAGVFATIMTADLMSVLTVALATCALVRLFTRPRRPSLRLLPISDGVARNLNRRFYWLIGVMATAYALTETLPLIGMPPSATTALLTIASLISAGMLIGVIVKHRRAVQYGIERSVTQGTLSGDVVRWLARRWHLIAILAVVALLVTYIVAGDGVFLVVAGRIGLSLLALIGSFVVWRLVVHLNERHARKLAAKQPDAEVTRQSSKMLLTMIARLLLAVIVIGLLIHIWLFDVIAWFGADAGRDLTEATVTIAIIITLAYAANRAIGAVIDRIQNSRRAESAEQRRRRVETLLPLLRNAAAVIIIAVTTLIVLSEIGLDITPLLASAGVIGLAIGFGAQSLVKDVITGLFILVEDTFGVGDIVTVAGYSGVVEEMSIRTIKLRDFSGTVHVIPFGVVDAASNMTRDFSFAVFEVGVSYAANVDEVIACMREVDEELRSDPEIAAKIIEPIDIVGLDQFGDNAVVIKARTKVHPAQQWGVMRAYNRLLKMRFDERGIEIPFPQRTLHVVQTGNQKGKDVIEPAAAEPVEPEATSDTPTPDHDH